MTEKLLRILAGFPERQATHGEWQRAAGQAGVPPRTFDYNRGVLERTGRIARSGDAWTFATATATAT